MADIVLQEFDIFDKYWTAAQKATIAAAMTALLAEKGVTTENIRIVSNTLPSRTTVTLTNPSKIETLNHDVVKTKVDALLVALG